MSWVAKNSRVTLLSKQTTTGAGELKYVKISNQSIFQIKLEGTSGALTATVELYGSNDPVAETDKDKAAKTTLKTFSLTGTGTGADATADVEDHLVNAQYSYFWAKVTGITGTGAAVSLWATI